MAKRLLIDTDVLIDYLKEQNEAVDYLENLTEPILISTITVAELYAGVKENEERTILEGFVDAFHVIPVNENIAKKGGLYRRD